MSDRKRCAFCRRDDSKISNEHAWPDWTRKCLPPNGGLRVELHRTTKVSSWSPRDSTGVTINDVCKQCNESWMHRLEELVRSFTCPLISSTAEAKFNESQMAALAFWAYKTALVFDLTAPRGSRLFLDDDYAEIHREQRAPAEGLVVWYGAFAGSMLGTATAHAVRLGSDSLRTVVSTLSIGRLAIQMFRYRQDGLPTRGVFIPHLPSEWRRALTLGWPILKTPGQEYEFSHPPDVMSDERMIELRNRFLADDLVLNGMFLAS
jgi:hypothetical protein